MARSSTSVPQTPLIVCLLCPLLPYFLQLPSSSSSRSRAGAVRALLLGGDYQQNPPKRDRCSPPVSRAGPCAPSLIGLGAEAARTWGGCEDGLASFRPVG